MYKAYTCMAIKSHTGCQSHIAKATFCLASDLLLGTACAPPIRSIPALASAI